MNSMNQEYQKNNLPKVVKTLFLTAVVFAFTTNTSAQNTNTQTETKTTISTKKDAKGYHKTVKNEVTKEVQNIELENAKKNTSNIPMKESPVMVTKTTTITNPDGTTRTVDIDRSAFYESDGNKYKLDLDASGYVMTFGNSKPVLLRKTSTNSYIYRSDSKTAIGYFDTNGNLIVEVYDDKSDKVTLEKFVIIK